MCVGFCVALSRKELPSVENPEWNIIIEWAVTFEPYIEVTWALITVVGL